jgi:hypothetical protein
VGKVTIYHNDACRFMPYEDGQPLIAVTSHWLDDTVAVGDAQAVAEWAFHIFNADLDMLEPGRDSAGGETAFLAACVYRLLGYRSVSVGDVIEVTSGDDAVWLACDPYGGGPSRCRPTAAGRR